ncbi:MAG: T9SS type A sorting domain-containing protein [Bacteroidota bacterium]
MNLNKSLVAIIFFTTIATFSSAQFCTQDERYTNAEYFSIDEIDSLSNITYANAINWQGNSEELQLDLYFPENSIDTASSRPFIMLIHGGGFEIGDKSWQRAECLEFAKRGYVTASINYRLGFNHSDPLGFQRAVYRAQQDANAALRYCIDIASSIKMDTSWIFIGGNSAGSITALFTNYFSQEEWVSFQPGVELALGSLNNNGNNLTHPFTIKGIFNNCGAAPYAIDLDELTPMVSFHGLLDNVVPIDTAAYGTLGSGSIHNKLNEEGICNDFTVDPLAGHCAYTSPEGTIFRIDRASCFFKSLFCQDCTSFYATAAVPAECSSLTTSLSEVGDTNEIIAYPNPFNNQLNISGLMGNEQFRLYDSFGRLIFEGTDLKSQNFRNLPPGLYLLTIEGDEWSQTEKLIKH